jgi:hypothetical protein
MDSEQIFKPLKRLFGRETEEVTEGCVKIT